MHKDRHVLVLQPSVQKCPWFGYESPTHEIGDSPLLGMEMEYVGVEDEVEGWEEEEEVFDYVYVQEEEKRKE